MTRKNMLSLGAGVVLAALLLAWALRPRAVEVELALVTQARFEMSIGEDAKTRLHERYVVAAPLAGQLARITLREGDAVAAGAVVATLTPVLPALLDARSGRELQARVEGAEARLQHSAVRIARASTAQEQARGESRRSEQLAGQGFVAATKLESDRLAERGAVQEVQAATAERHIAEHELDQARAALMAVRMPITGTEARSFGVRAPVAGQVLRVLQASEASVALGTPLLELGDVSKLEVVAELLTTDALSAAPGARVLIERWGGAGVLEGRVKHIEPAAFTKVSALGVEEQRVRALIELTSPREKWQALGDGYRVSVRVITLAQDKVLTVPVSAVFPLAASAAPGDTAAAARYAVFTVQDGRARQVAIELGGRNGQLAWVKSGLALGAPVVIYPPTTVREGVRVAQRTP